ncbi:peptide deformylase [Sneathiella sp.]|jgi:peptide deformylase|uniref:peptide deformylase n=1 Tax=Sneathiella sp. TaxID=1964365 RepID=UPI0039E47F8A
MPAKPIVKMGNPVLSQRAEEIDDPTAPEIRKLVKQMQESLKEAGGIGLAAPQIGVPLRLVIFGIPAARLQSEDGNPDGDGLAQRVLINPELEPLGPDISLGWEGCLSVPGLRGLVPRYTRLRYRAFDLQGQRQDVVAEGFHARVVQHECDHLDGILYVQRMTDIRNLVYEDEMGEFMKHFSLTEGKD